MKLPDQISGITLPNRYADAGGFPYPLGFHPFTKCASDEGDVFGLYWPVGVEEQPPLVIKRWQDSWEMVPLFSNLEQFLAECPKVCEGVEHEVRRDAPSGSQEISTDHPSPATLPGNAVEARKRDNHASAIESLEKGLQTVPE